MYVVGGFDFPTGAGDYHVVLGFRPVGLLMIGGNIATVGSLVTAAPGPCVWMSLNAQELGGTRIASLCASVQSYTNNPGTDYVAYRWDEIPVRVPANGTNVNAIDYRADTVTFDDDGFTLHVATGAPSRRPVHYMVFGDDDLDARAYQGELGGTRTHTYPFEPSTLVVLATDFAAGSLLTSGIFEGGQANEIYFTKGGGNYPQGSSTWEDTSTDTIFAQGRLSGAVGREGFLENHVWTITDEIPDGPSPHIGLAVTHPLSLLIALQENYRRYRPPTVPPVDQLLSTGGAFSGQAATAMVWNGHGLSAHAHSPGTVVAPTYDNGGYHDPLTEEFGDFKAVLFQSINGGIATGAGWDVRFGFGLLGEDYQGCVTMGEDGSFYQSLTECAAEVATAAGGVNSSTGTIDGDEFTLTDEKGLGFGQGFEASFQAWGEGEDTPTTWHKRRYRGQQPVL